MRPSRKDPVFLTVSVFFAAYLFFLVKLFFLQVNFHWGVVNVVINRQAPGHELLAMANVVPLHKIIYYARGCEPYSVGLLNVAGNVAVFVPMGLALPFFFGNLQTAKRLWRVAAFISLVVELLQLSTATGVFDVDDVLLNTAGALIGHSVFCAAQTNRLPRYGL